jgi:hypothetical protein
MPTEVIMDPRADPRHPDQWTALNVPTDEEIALAEALRREIERRLLPQPEAPAPDEAFGAQHYAWAEAFRKR